MDYRRQEVKRQLREFSNLGFKMSFITKAKNIPAKTVCDFMNGRQKTISDKNLIKLESWITEIKDNVSNI